MSAVGAQGDSTVKNSQEFNTAPLPWALRSPACHNIRDMGGRPGALAGRAVSL